MAVAVFLFKKIKNNIDLLLDLIIFSNFISIFQFYLFPNFSFQRVGVSPRFFKIQIFKKALSQQKQGNKSFIIFK